MALSSLFFEWMMATYLMTFRNNFSILQSTNRRVNTNLTGYIYNSPAQRRYNKDPTTEPGTLTTYTRCLAQLRLPSVLFLAATKRRPENSGKDHKLWPGRFPGTGEYGRMFHGNCVIMLREVWKYLADICKIQRLKAKDYEVYLLSILFIFRSSCTVGISVAWCCLSSVSSAVSWLKGSQRQETVARRLGPAPHREPSYHCVWLLIKAMIIQSWSPEGASN